LTAYRSGKPHIDDEDIWQDLNEILLKAMVNAHVSGTNAYAALKKSRSSATMSRSKKYLERVPKKQQSAITSLYSMFADATTNKTAAKVRNTLLLDIAALIKEKPTAYAKQTSGIVERLGIGRNEKSGVVESLVRTQTSIAFNAATWVAAQDDEELWGFEYSTAGDERVRETHVPFDGVRYPKDHEFWKMYAPPNGWRCRCTLNPIYIGDKDAREKKFKGTPEVPKEFKFNAGALFE
jgi:SPP1 gp7 family putative phage head morphogenesis protein